jgi:hypothetical protein
MLAVAEEIEFPTSGYGNLRSSPAELRDQRHSADLGGGAARHLKTGRLDYAPMAA